MKINMINFRRDSFLHAFTSATWWRVCVMTLLTLSFLQVSAQQTASQMRETAMAFQRQGDYGNAVIVLNRAIEQAPGSMELLTDLAYVYYLQRDFGKAIDIIKPLTEQDDAEIRTYQIAGNIYRAIAEISACERMYRRALKKYPDSGPLNAEYGEMLQARRDGAAAVAQWEKGIQLDPSYPVNYYHAARYYFSNGEMLRSLIYGEIFLNMDTYSGRSAEVKELLLEAYKNFYANPTGPKLSNLRKRTPFEEAFKAALLAQSPVASMGIDVNRLIMIRTRFVLQWFNAAGETFPHRMIDQLRQLLREGLFEAYNQWLFGAASNAVEYQMWAGTHAEDIAAFSRFQQNRVFRMPAGQYYGAVD
jgi:Tfp pilus assembly protein PilF